MVRAPESYKQSFRTGSQCAKLLLTRPNKDRITLRVFCDGSYVVNNGVGSISIDSTYPPLKGRSGPITTGHTWSIFGHKVVEPPPPFPLALVV